MEHLVRMTVLGAVAWACLMSASYALYAESPEDEPPRYCTVFTHFVKSGGSTLKRQLVESSNREDTRQPGLIRSSARTSPLTPMDTIHNSSVIMGCAEMLREPLEVIGRDCEYFTMMRNPIERLVSAFYYCPTDHDIQNRPAKWCGDAEGQEEALQGRLVEFAENMWGNKAFMVMMPSIICDPGFELCQPEHARENTLRPRNINTDEGWLFHQAMKSILSTYTAVGIFEEWELSMRLFNAKVTSPVREWRTDVVTNQGTRSAAREELLDWAYTSVELHTTLAADMLLYDYALALFRNQTKHALLL